MGQQVCAGAMLQCSFGMAPTSLIVLPQNHVMATTPAANIMDHTPMNIPTFGMCQSLANPAVAAATTAAMGVLTPMPCTPLIPAPWLPGNPKVLIGNMPALTTGSCCMCAMGSGSISIVNPGQIKVQE